MNIDKFTITSYDQLTGFDRTNGSLDMILDELNDFTLSQEEEKVEIGGKGGRTIGSLKKNKKVTGKGTNGMLSGGALATTLGADKMESSKSDIQILLLSLPIKVLLLKLLLVRLVTKSEQFM